MLDEGRIADAMTDQLEGHDRVGTFFAISNGLPFRPFPGFSKRRYPRRSVIGSPCKTRLRLFPQTKNNGSTTPKALFIEAVHCRLRTPCPISAMLSGGLDSSSVIAVASENLR